MKSFLRRALKLLIVALLLGGGYYFGSKYLWPAPDTSIIQTVGIIEAPEVNVTSRIAGRIAQLDLLEGDTVERGQVICRIEDVDIRNQLAKARGDLVNATAALRNAQIAMDRNEKLYAEHVISTKDRDDARAALDSNRGAVAAAQANVQYYADQLNDTVIRSPIAGTVVSKNLEVGEWVTPGTPVITIDDLSTVWARVNLEETDLGAIRIGSPAQVTLPTHPPLVFSGQVMAIGQEGQFATETDVRRGRQDIRTFYVKVRLLQNSGQVKPGMTAEVAFPLNNGIIASSDPGPRTH
ncbi:MAG TPA: efflux RND transporter periplasmic adaptor subunit [Candidatus Binataceae bacterium]|nr:efflux RND transporter periplasmic adaptor subunit [Candidatus Binataceae bacterium]